MILNISVIGGIRGSLSLFLNAVYCVMKYQVSWPGYFFAEKSI